MFIDTHAHINFNIFKDDADEVIKRALEEDIWFINVGSQEITSRRAVELAEKYPQGVYAAIGLHPIHISNQIVDEEESAPREQDWDFSAYQQLVSHKKVVAIGEVGFDFYRVPENTDIEEIKKPQTDNFWQHIELAVKYNKPLIIHCRKAHPETIALLKEATKKYDNLRGVIHSFSGRWSQAEEYLELGFFISFNGIITYDRSYDKVIKNMPLENILLETDSPYLTPEPFRGQRNEPSCVKYVAQKVAEIKGAPLEEIAEITTVSAKKLFNMV